MLIKKRKFVEIPLHTVLIATKSILYILINSLTKVFCASKISKNDLQRSINVSQCFDLLAFYLFNWLHQDFPKSTCSRFTRIFIFINFSFCILLLSVSSVLWALYLLAYDIYMYIGNTQFWLLLLNKFSEK